MKYALLIILVLLTARWLVFDVDYSRRKPDLRPTQNWGEEYPLTDDELRALNGVDDLEELEEK
ncbi:hypothetical protein [Gimesia maris]|uniref:hypothetical protein n=1 Tax=Gimesia maris TaxID=122 RepID=UPI0032F042EE